MKESRKVDLITLLQDKTNIFEIFVILRNTAQLYWLLVVNGGALGGEGPWCWGPLGPPLNPALTVGVAAQLSGQYYLRFVGCI